MDFYAFGVWFCFFSTNVQCFVDVTYIIIKATNNVTGATIEVCGNGQPEMEITSPNLTRLDLYKLMIVENKSVLCHPNKENFYGQILQEINDADPRWDLPHCQAKYRSSVERVFAAQDKNASAILLLHNPTYSSFRNLNYNNSLINIPIYFVNDYAFSKIQNLFDYNSSRSSEVQLVFSEFTSSLLQPGLIVILIMTMICIILGGLWSGYEHRQLFLLSEAKRLKKAGFTFALKSKSPKPTPSSETQPKSTKSISQPSKLANITDQQNDSKQASQNDSKQTPQNETNLPHPGPPIQVDFKRKSSLSITLSSTVEMPSQKFTFWTVIWLIIPVVVVFLLLYFLYVFFVWVIIVLFTISATVAMYMCISFIMTKCVTFGKGRGFSFDPVVGWMEKRTKRDFASFKCFIEYRDIALFIICASCSIADCIMRKNPYVFISHNFLGMLFCIYNIQQVRISNLKWITILLTALLIYDVFMVFISPFITKGCSIMVDVATGGACSAGKGKWGLPNKTREDLPILFRVPRFDPSTKCYNLNNEDLRMTMLGLADVIVPGFLVGFNRSFDIDWNIPFSFYFVSSVIGYFFGMITTFTVLILSAEAQPALIYLVPFTLIPTHLLALQRRQWKLMWNGIYPFPNELTMCQFMEQRAKDKSLSSSAKKKRKRLNVF